MSSITEESRLDRSRCQVGLGNYGFIRAGICLCRSRRQIPPSVHLPEETAEQKDHGVYVIVQRREVLFRPAQLCGRACERHSWEAEAVEEDGDLLRILLG